MKAPFGPELNFPQQQPPLPPQQASSQPPKSQADIEKEELQKQIDEMYKGSNDNSDQYNLHK